MKKQDFTTTIVVDQQPDKVFSAINNPGAWWPGEITGDTENLNDEFTYRYQEFHVSRQKVVEMIPDKKVVWLVTDGQLNFVEDKTEWTNTKITFEIYAKGSKTELRFAHFGLVPDMECFGTCSNAWTDLIQKGLFGLITKGIRETTVLD